MVKVGLALVYYLPAGRQVWERFIELISYKLLRGGLELKGKHLGLLRRVNLF